VPFVSLVEGGKNRNELPGGRVMREFGSFDKRLPSRDVKVHRIHPKPDFVRATLTSQELHAYYIALICSSTLSAAPDGLHLKAS
jgi:hypothetical protein